MEVNLNINELINELRSMYDTLKYTKASLNSSIRLLNNAYSRKERKLNEFTTYTQKAQSIKESLINSTRGSVDDISNRKKNISNDFSITERRISELQDLVQAYSSRNNLTMSQQASVDLFVNFSNQIKNYIDQNIYQLRNYKYDEISNFVKNELVKNGESLYSQWDFANMVSGLIQPLNTALDKAEELISLKQQKKSAQDDWDVYWNRNQLALEKLEFELPQLDNIKYNAEAVLAAATKELAEAVAVGESGEVIDQLTNAKDQAQYKLSDAQDKYNQIQEQLFEVQQGISNLEENTPASIYGGIIVSVERSIISLYNKFIDNRSQFVDTYYGEFMKVTGNRLDLYINGRVADLVADSSSAAVTNMAYDLSGLMYQLNQDFKYSTDYQFGSSLTTISGPNIDLIPVDRVNFQPQFLLGGGFNWKTQDSFALNSYWYQGIREYFDLVKQLAGKKRFIDILNARLGQHQANLQYLLDSKNGLIYTIDELAAQVEKVMAEKSSVSEQIQSLYNQINTLSFSPTTDSSDLDVITTFESLRNQINDLHVYDSNTLFPQLQSAQVKQSQKETELNFLNDRISQVSDIISGIDNEIRNKNSELLSFENEVKVQYESLLNPENGQLINNFYNPQSCYQRMNGYSDTLGNQIWLNDIQRVIKSSYFLNIESFKESKIYQVFLSHQGGDYMYTDQVLSYMSNIFGYVY